MNLNPISREWRCQHVLADVVLGSFSSVVISAILISFIPPAWAFSIPVGDRLVIDLGQLPLWIGSLVAFAVWWDARQAKKSAAEAALKAAAGVEKIEAVAHQIDGLLADRDKAKVKEGEVKGERAGERAAEQLAEGQRQGREIERESVAAQATPSAAPAGKHPLPVADDKNTKAGERVADATERMADAQGRFADAAQIKGGDDGSGKV